MPGKAVNHFIRAHHPSNICICTIGKELLQVTMIRSRLQNPNTNFDFCITVKIESNNKFSQVSAALDISSKLIDVLSR